MMTEVDFIVNYILVWRKQTSDVYADVVNFFFFSKANKHRLTNAASYRTH